MRDGMTLVKSFINEAEAQLAVSHLHAMGVDSLLESDNCGGMRPHMDLTGGVHLLVADGDRERALALLRGSGEAAVAEAWTCRCGEEIEAGFDTCWKCGATKA